MVRLYKKIKIHSIIWLISLSKKLKMGNFNIGHEKYISEIIEQCSNDYDEHLIQLSEPVSIYKPISELKKQIEKIKPPGILKLYIGDKLINDDTLLINKVLIDDEKIKYETEPSQKDIQILIEITHKVKEYLEKKNKNIINVYLNFCYDENNRICSFYEVEIPRDEYINLRIDSNRNFNKYPPRVKLNKFSENKLNGTIRIEYSYPHGIDISDDISDDII
jgi:hypothetical protein